MQKHLFLVSFEGTILKDVGLHSGLVLHHECIRDSNNKEGKIPISANIVECMWVRSAAGMESKAPAVMLRRKSRVKIIAFNIDCEKSISSFSCCVFSCSFSFQGGHFERTFLIKI